jgi:hypothetical protein
VGDKWKDRTDGRAWEAGVRIARGPCENRLIPDLPPTLKAEEQGGSRIGPQP